MHNLDDIIKAKQFLFDKGYSKGSDFKLLKVAELMAEWAAKNRSTPDLVGVKEQIICPHCGNYKRLQGWGFIHQLCECGITD